MTFSPLPVIRATLQSLAAHGVELPAVPTRIIAPYQDKVFIDLDLSNGTEGKRLSTDMRNLIPTQFFHNGRPNDTYWIGHMRLLQTEVTFRLYEYDQDFSA